MDTLTVMLGIAGFLINLIVLAVGGTYKLSQVEGSIRGALYTHREEMDEEISNLKINFAATIAAERRDTGESLLAIRTKVNEVELYVRDTFVERSTFTQIIQTITSDIRALGDRIESRMLRMEGKMDQVITGQHPKN